VLAREPITQAERCAFLATNRLPDSAFRPIWVPMQLGTFGTVPTAAAFALARRRPRLAVAIASSGTAAWVLAKATKRVVHRGRPAQVLEGVSIRGREEGDRGFPSGHAAVSAALTVVLWPSASRGSRALLGLLATSVSIARMYVRVHFPLDVVGGAALGLATGSAVNLVILERDQAEKIPAGGFERAGLRVVG
jgi:membrane-associated phospholipid phosphatase